MRPAYMLNTFFFRSRLRAVSHGVYLPSISESSGISCFVRRPRKMQIESNNWGQSKLKFFLPYLIFYPLISVKTDGKINPSVSNRDPRSMWSSAGTIGRCALLAGKILRLMHVGWKTTQKNTRSIFMRGYWWPTMCICYAHRKPIMPSAVWCNRWAGNTFDISISAISEPGRFGKADLNPVSLPFATVSLYRVESRQIMFGRATR